MTSLANVMDAEARRDVILPAIPFCVWVVVIYISIPHYAIFTNPINAISMKEIPTITKIFPPFQMKLSICRSDSNTILLAISRPVFVNLSSERAISVSSLFPKQSKHNQGKRKRKHTSQVVLDIPPRYTQPPHHNDK